MISPRHADAPIRLVGLSGSLRAASFNTALLRAAGRQAPDGVIVDIHLLDDIPFYDGDLERLGAPAPVRRLRAAVAAADGLLLASPEYNHSTTGVLKNAIDWLSRGPDAPIDRIPTALLSAAGGSGGRRAQGHLRDILAHNDVDVIAPSVQIARAGQYIEDGEVSADDVRAEIAALVVALVERIRARTPAAESEARGVA